MDADWGGARPSTAAEGAYFVPGRAMR